MRVALYQPDIPQNAGAIMRLAACLGLGLDVIEPCGFALDDRRLRRAGMDYLDRLELTRHDSWRSYCESRGPGRLVLLTTAGKTSYADFAYREDDTLMVGRESAGVPPSVQEAADARLRIPVRPGLRSLNVALALAMAAGEALRQTGSFPRAG